MRKLIWWYCPKCGWAVSDLEYKLIQFDARCGGCHSRDFSQFSRYNRKRR